MLPLVLGILIVIVGVFVILFGREQARQHAANEQLVEFLSQGESLDFDATDDFQSRLSAGFLERVLRPALSTINEVVTGHLPGNPLERATERLGQAGLTAQYRAEEVVAVQVACALIGLGLGVVVLFTEPFATSGNIALFILLPIIGALIPGVLLRRRADERQASIRSDLPDILDLLAISVEAGVGFEGAIRVVTERFESPLATEFDRLLSEMELGVSRRDALQAMRSRTDVTELSGVIVALVQADTLGISVGTVLKAQAAEMRIKRRQWAREKAGKLPVKILFPLMFCIFPAVLVIVLGPAGSNIRGAFK